MAAQKFYEGQEFVSDDPSKPTLVYKAGKFVPKPVYSGPAVSQDSLQSGQVVLAAIDKAKKQIVPGATGLLGKWGTGIGGTPGYNLDRTTDTIKGNLSFGKLMQMKQQSPTGASGLGALSEGENRMLQSLAGSIDVGQSAPQFRQNLDEVRQYVLHSTPGVNVDVPLDLSAGQSREAIPRMAFYRDPQGNIRRNENGDKGNPIMRGPGLQQQRPATQAPAPQAQGVLKPGHVEDGHVYLGGPPGDPKSWQAVRP